MKGEIHAWDWVHAEDGLYRDGGLLVPASRYQKLFLTSVGNNSVSYLNEETLQEANHLEDAQAFIPAVLGAEDYERDRDGTEGEDGEPLGNPEAVDGRDQIVRGAF